MKAKHVTVNPTAETVSTGSNTAIWNSAPTTITTPPKACTGP